MLTDEMKAQGWVEHDGGPCPVEAKSKPGVMFQNGVTIRPDVEIAAWWSWPHVPDDEAYRIIAYKPEQPNG